MSITFEVNKVRRQEQHLRTMDATAIWERRAKPRPEACSPGQYVDCLLNPLVGAIGIAYNQHRPLALSPDAIWVTLMQGFGMHVNANAEELRHCFVQHEGKKYIEIRRDNFRKGDPSNDWPGAFSEFSDRIAEYIGKKRDLIIADFSTTTPTSRAASEIVLMDAMKSYFRYGMRTLCGFPSITLEGTVADWESILTRAMNLAEFKLDFWLDHLIPVLEELVQTAKGNVKTSFWEQLYKEGGGSGGPHVSGWVNTFFPYFDSSKGPHKSPYIDWRQRRGFGGPNPDSFPSGLSKAPMLWHYQGTTFTMNLIGGLVGVEQDADGTVRPGFGWAVADDPEAVKDHECASADPLDYDPFCMHCGRTLSRAQLQAQQDALYNEARATIDKERGPVKDERDEYNRKDAAYAALHSRAREKRLKDEVATRRPMKKGTPEQVEKGEADYSVTEPEYVGEMNVRSELFSEPRSKVKGWSFEEKVGEVYVDPDLAKRGR